MSRHPSRSRSGPAPRGGEPVTVFGSAGAPDWVFGSALVGVYALSGLTSLAYEVLWARVLALQFGVSIFSVVAVVVAFMGGLGAGSLVGMRLASRVARPLRIFATLETGIALFALAMPWALTAADGLLSGLAARTTLVQWYLLLGGAAALFLALPALAMGIGFPLVLQAARGRGIGLNRVYGWNTLGGAVGAMLPLALLPTFGWLASTQIVALIGLSLSLGAYLLSRVGVDAEARATTSAPALPATSLFAYAGVGAASLMLEIGWTRLYGMVLLRTEYVLAILLAVFLVGIGVGSLLAGFADRPGWFEAVPVAASVAALISLRLLPAVSSWADGATFDSLTQALVLQGSVLAAATLPVTLLLGMWFPLLSARLGGDNGAGARLYALNSLGAASGVLLAGVALIPSIGTAATTALAAALLLAFGLVWMRGTWRWPALLVVCAGAWLSRELPPLRQLQPRSMPESHDLYVHEDAVTITHVADQGDGQRVLLDDLQRVDASTSQWDVEEQKSQARLPLLLHPDPRTVLFLGLGTGISAAGSLPFPGLERYAVEISSGAIEATRRWFAPANGGVAARMTIVRDDAVRFLRADTRQYDVIVGDLFHPDLPGRSALLSRQQFERVRARLALKGVFIQWMAIHQFDRESLEVVMRTFASVFPEGSIFLNGYRLALVGGSGATHAAPSVLPKLERMTGAQAALATGGEGAWTWLSRYWGPVDVGPGPIQDEWAPRIEYRLARARHGGELDVGLVQAYLLDRRPAVESAALALRVPDGDRGQFERAYEATTMAQLSNVVAREPGREREALRLTELQARPLTSFVRNRLINDTYLPIIGDNLAKQIGTVGEAKRSDLMGLLMMISPPGYGKTTLMEYVAHRLGLVFVKVNGPALGHEVRSLDPAQAPDATSRQELEKLGLALEMGNNVMLYVDDIQHRSDE
ncbi:MAG: fused MFS/spermidine synthase, partial [Gemmatimonadetes bacterium]|nr:fused MFS/spermidine synthase [Gemmatimonadota bacterium]